MFGSMQSVFLSVLIFISACVQTNNNTKVATAPKESPSKHLKTENSIRDVVDHPAFRGFGDHLLPWEDNSQYMNTPLSRVGTLMPYHSNVKPEVIVDALNHMIDQVDDGKT